MEIGEEDVRAITESIWSTMLGVTLERIDGAPIERGVTGSVSISGAWAGAIELCCGPELARVLASLMFGTAEDEVSADLVKDALGELANVAGGSLKTRVPSPSYLSLPAISEGDDPNLVPGSRVLTRVAFRHAGQPFSIAVIEHPSQPPKANEP